MLISEDAHMFSLVIRGGINICISGHLHLTYLNELGYFIYMFKLIWVRCNFTYVNVCFFVNVNIVVNRTDW